MLVALGMLLYTVIVSPGYFAQRGEWPLVAMFGVLLLSALVFARRMRPESRRLRVAEILLSVLVAAAGAAATLLMLVTGWAGFLLSHLGRHDLARSTFIATFCVLLFFVCNSVDVGFYFIPFFFPALLAFSLYYDLDHDFLNASVNLAICVGCTLLSVFLPQH